MKERQYVHPCLFNTVLFGPVLGFPSSGLAGDPVYPRKAARQTIQTGLEILLIVIRLASLFPASPYALPSSCSSHIYIQVIFIPKRPLLAFTLPSLPLAALQKSDTVYNLCNFNMDLYILHPSLGWTSCLRCSVCCDGVLRVVLQAM